jgi:hypothetical protein
MRRGDALQSIDSLRLLLFDADEENEVSVGQIRKSPHHAQRTCSSAAIQYDCGQLAS